MWYHVSIKGLLSRFFVYRVWSWYPTTTTLPCKHKNWFKVAICNEFFFDRSIPTHYLVVKASHSESCDMGSLLDAETPCSHFEPVSACTLLIFFSWNSFVVISPWQGFNSWNENQTSTVLEHLKSGQGSGLGHTCGLGYPPDWKRVSVSNSIWTAQHFRWLRVKAWKWSLTWFWFVSTKFSSDSKNNDLLCYWPAYWRLGPAINNSTSKFYPKFQDLSADLS